MENFWLLNPDAELELASLSSGKTGGYTTSASLRASMSGRRAAFDELTWGEKSLLSYELDQLTRPAKDSFAFFLWCPTPSLLVQCRRLGLHVPPSPDRNLLALVNDKTRLPEWALPVVPDRGLLTRAEDLKAFQERHEVLRLKRPFGFAGRGQRRITARLSPDDVRWVSGGLKLGPLVVEPELDDVRVRSVHLLVHEEEIIVGQPVGFHCDEFGAFQSWDRCIDPAPLTESLRLHAKNAGKKLRSAGYSGPAGIDFAVEESGAIYALDLNGRFSLGWSRGMGEERSRALLLHRTQES